MDKKLYLETEDGNRTETLLQENQKLKDVIEVFKEECGVELYRNKVGGDFYYTMELYHPDDPYNDSMTVELSKKQYELLKEVF